MGICLTNLAIFDKIKKKMEKKVKIWQELVFLSVVAVIDHLESLETDTIITHLHTTQGMIREDIEVAMK